VPGAEAPPTEQPVLLGPRAKTCVEELAPSIHFLRREGLSDRDIHVMTVVMAFVPPFTPEISVTRFPIIHFMVPAVRMMTLRGEVTFKFSVSGNSMSILVCGMIMGWFLIGYYFGHNAVVSFALS
jgi:hypothetical protein